MQHGFSFAAEIARAAQCSFAQFCDALANDEAILLLDDVTTGVEQRPGAVSVERDIESLVALLRDYSPHLKIVLRSRRRPRDAAFGLVSLAPLDEADLKVYLGDHERGGSGLTDVDTVGVLFRLTDGYPMRVDGSLKELAVVTLDELASSNDDYSQGDGPPDSPPHSVPIALKRAVQALSDAADKPTKRSFGLLQALAVFPQGAEFARVKRFNGVNPFHPIDAAELQERALITVSETPEVGQGEGRQAAKVLVVPRPVRDYLRDTLHHDALGSLNIRAAEILFGTDWMAGSTKWPSDLDYSSAKCRSADIANAAALIARLFRHHKVDPNSRESSALLALAASFAEALNEGSHYTSTSNFCQDILPLIGDDFSREKKAQLLRHYARALRMLGVKDRANTISREVLDYPIDGTTRQSVLINLALSLERGDSPQAVAIAKQVIKINRYNSRGYQAQAIILEAQPRSPERTRKLEDLEKATRRKGFTTAADNIALSLASEADDEHEADQLLQRVLASTDQAKEFYNGGRAILELTQRKATAGQPLTNADLVRLVDCYKFLLSERVPWMLNKCHSILWQAFKQRREWRNLLTLFRYSSVIWRLRGEEQHETTYLQQLRDTLGNAGDNQLPNDQITQYYLSRLARLENRPTNFATDRDT